MYMYTYIISYEHILIIPIWVYRLVNYTIYLMLTQSFLKNFRYIDVEEKIICIINNR